MSRTLFSAAVAAVLLLGLQYAFWLFAPWHERDVEDLPQEEVMTPLFREYVPKPGVYQFPGSKGLDPESRLERAAWLEKVRQGPVGYLIIRPKGGDPMAIGVPVRGFALNFVALLPIVWLIGAGAGGQSFLRRWLAVTALGIAAASATHLQLWNWFFVPARFSLAQALDLSLAWSIIGVFVALISPKRRPTPTVTTPP